MQNFNLCYQYFTNINLNHLSVGWQKYYAIPYYFVLLHFVEVDKKAKFIKKIKHLIEETHFSYYSLLLKSFPEASFPEIIYS
ncbi:hypothetical protein [Elizabethkingia sp. JS20170427COW]|uniref:hypothetical protein n=1 Tax=Elizabethkingia sp. JS20170427COW TaxID=2583851 RepID=UPI00111047E0|nr:hypothetical protein [Elizabethkingia sp. JS20170427COW]QCX53922.1 hypothetical protein FGE20_09350 [Elizabethkingia sp. JS20170427COW]